MLKKITTAEAYHNKNTTQNADIYKLCKNLLSAAKALKPNFTFHISADKTHKINILLFSLLLLTISKHSDKCKIEADQNNIIIKANLSPESLSALLSALGGYSFFDKINNRTLFVIPSPITDKPPIYTQSEWEYIFDKFSIVNVFLENIHLN